MIKSNALPSQEQAGNLSPYFTRISNAYFESGLAAHLHHRMPSFLIIYLCYLKHADWDDGVARPHPETVARECGVGLRTVYDAQAILLESGLASKLNRYYCKKTKKERNGTAWHLMPPECWTILRPAANCSEGDCAVDRTAQPEIVRPSANCEGDFAVERTDILRPVANPPTPPSKEEREPLEREEELLGSRSSSSVATDSRSARASENPVAARSPEPEPTADAVRTPPPPPAAPKAPQAPTAEGLTYSQPRADREVQQRKEAWLRHWHRRYDQLTPTQIESHRAKLRAIDPATVDRLSPKSPRLKAMIIEVMQQEAQSRPEMASGGVGAASSDPRLR